MGLEHISGTIRITFGVVKMSEPVAPSPMHMVGVGRLITTERGAQSLCLELYHFLKGKGLDPLALVRGNGETAQ